MTLVLAGMTQVVHLSMVRLQSVVSAALALFALAAVCADASSLDVAAIARLHIPEWAVQQTGGGRELLQLVAGNLSNIPQQTVSAAVSLHLHYFVDATVGRLTCRTETRRAIGRPHILRIYY